jgi:hypothetical protein
MVMNGLYALIAVISLILSAICLIALLIGRSRHRAAKLLAGSVLVFITAVIMFQPEVKSTEQVQQGSEGSTPGAGAGAGAKTSDGAAEPTITAAAATNEPGMARICLTGDDVKLPPGSAIAIPATTVLEDQGPLKGTPNDPSTWGYEVRGDFHAALITLLPATIRSKQHCAEVPVQMLVSDRWTETAQRASDGHIFAMTDVIDYPIPPKRPAVEIGKLIDDISVTAILIADVTASTKELAQTLDDESRAAACLDGAKKLAAHLGGGVGRQTSMVVIIGGVTADETSYGCAFGPKNAPDVFIAWSGQAKPPAKTQALIANAGEYLTRATRTEISQETAACVSAALKPDSGELSDREFRGVKIECQAFARDGGGGSVTIYRRFGASPVRGDTPPDRIAATNKASGAIRVTEAKSAADAMAFAQWWQDPTIPKEVKTFAMMASRAMSLAERCPTAKLPRERIAVSAASAGVDPSDIAPGGRYSSLMTSMLATMRAGVQSESVKEACQALKQYE